MNQQYSDRDINNFVYDNQQFILLTEPARYDLLSQVIEDKRTNYIDEAVKFIAGTDITSPTVEFFSNNITSAEYCDAFMERVYQHENSRLFRWAFNYGTAIQRSEIMIDPNTVGRDLIELLNPGRIRFKLYKTSALNKYIYLLMMKTIIWRLLIEYSFLMIVILRMMHHLYFAIENLSINSRKMQDLLSSHNGKAEYKRVQYYITYRFQTAKQKVCGRNYQILIPTTVASTIEAKNYINTISFDQSEYNIVVKWLEELFNEAIQVRSDNKLSEEVPQRYEVPIIGFDQVYDSLCNDLVWGNSFINHRENTAGLPQIHKF
ncbi:MAG: hypothetical protein EZS28_029574 [Streblomastix strix]|uniref:Uncharacterized protein n=1 Tax=Streblomastix strix TaxID=222440 RepID=A0A5J4UWQ5_9EUKA|nr:MAG: hypothetical protein EZS28_029574 [Streblomastix strix]